MTRTRKIELTKMVVGTVASYGAGIITMNIIDNNLPELATHKKVAVFVGGLVVGALVKDAVVKKSDALIDQIVATYDKAMKKN
jgi:hypothetical protein